LSLPKTTCTITWQQGFLKLLLLPERTEITSYRKNTEIWIIYRPSYFKKKLNSKLFTPIKISAKKKKLLSRELNMPSAMDCAYTHLYLWRELLYLRKVYAPT
jgi:hypothetical protein